VVVDASQIKALVDLVRLGASGHALPDDVRSILALNERGICTEFEIATILQRLVASQRRQAEPKSEEKSKSAEKSKSEEKLKPKLNVVTGPKASYLVGYGGDYGEVANLEEAVEFATEALETGSEATIWEQIEVPRRGQ
jgi:hypothetical protein